MAKVSKEEFEQMWNVPVIKIGRSTLLLSVLFSFFPSAYLYFAHGAFPPIGTALKAWGMIAAVFGAFYVVEPISYYSIFGLTGTYMSFLSGNIGNLRLPCAAMALEITETEPGTQEAEIISTIGIAGSIIVNIIGTTLAALIGAKVIAVLPDTILTALSTYTAPAIFGAMFGSFGIKFPKLAIFGLGIPVAIRLLLPTTPAFIIILAAVFGTIFIAKILYDKQKKNSDGASA